MKNFIRRISFLDWETLVIDILGLLKSKHSLSLEDRLCVVEYFAHRSLC